jgi:hypothetical protein
LLNIPLCIYNLLPKVLNAHNLSTQLIPPAYKLLLGLGLKFCLTPKQTSSQITLTTALDRFSNDIYCKYIFGTNNEFNAKFYCCTNYQFSSHQVATSVLKKIGHFREKISLLFSKTLNKPLRSNLSISQKQTLQWLRNSETTLVVKSDKNLGPVLVDRKEYLL